MIELQLLTGMRPAEVCAMRGCDIDTSGKMWLYRPASHKTQHHGYDRTVFLGPKAQAIVLQSCISTGSSAAAVLPEAVPSPLAPPARGCWPTLSPGSAATRLSTCGVLAGALVCPTFCTGSAIASRARL